MALDLFVQRSRRCRGNNSHAFLLAAKREDIKKRQHLLAVVRTSRLARCCLTTGSLHATSLFAPTEWEYSSIMEQRSHYFHLDGLWGMLDRLFRLGLLALPWQYPSTSGYFPFHYCACATDWPSDSVRCSLRNPKWVLLIYKKPHATHWLPFFSCGYKLASALPGSQWRLSYHGWYTFTTPVVLHGVW